MGRYIAKRLGFAVITLFLLSVGVFWGVNALSGNPARRMLGNFASEESVRQLAHEIGTDRPLVVQYGHWIGNLLQGDLGDSYNLRRPVSTLVGSALVKSSKLALVAFVIVVPLSLLAGVMAGRRKGSVADRTITTIGLAGIAIPEFVSGFLLIYLLAIERRLTLIAGVVLVVFAATLVALLVMYGVARGRGRDPDPSSVRIGLVALAISLVVFAWARHVKALESGALAPDGANLITQVKHLLLPASCLVIVLFGYIARMARAGTIEATESDFTRTAVLKGLPERTVLRRHVLPNALLPTITVIGTQIGYLVGGLVAVEFAFNYPGMGRLIRDAVVQKDLPLLQSAVLVVGIVYLVATLVTDLLVVVLNPRVRAVTFAAA